MAKKKKITGLDSIKQKTGGQSLNDTGVVPWYHDLGNFAANYICSGKFMGGGLPGGKIVEVYGAEATAKSLLGYCFLGGIQRSGGIAALMDMERAGNATFAENAGHVDSGNLLTYEPENWYQLENTVFDLITAIRAEKDYKETPIGIMLDSIGVVQSLREWKLAQLPIDATEKQKKDIGTAERPGERAKAAGDFLRRVNPFLDKNKATLYIINQLRSNISTMKYAPKSVSSGGGKALPYYASTRVLMRAQTVINDKDTEVPLGGRLAMDNRKSRSFTPGLKTEGIKLYYDGGIDPLSGLLTVMLGSGRVFTGKGNGNFVVDAKYAPDGKELKFKGSKSKERNEMSPEIILQCPGLVDGETTEQVENYLNLWQGAMAKSSGNIIEKELDPETKKLQDVLGSDYFKKEEEE